MMSSIRELKIAVKYIILIMMIMYSGIAPAVDVYKPSKEDEAVAVVANNACFSSNFARCKALADNNNYIAQMLVGMQYLVGVDLSGKAMSRDIPKAKMYLEKAASQNYAPAQSALGDMYFNGTEITKDYTKAKMLFDQAVEQGDRDAQYSLGLMYLSGLGVTKDYSKAKMYFELAAKQNNTKALHALGRMYYTGTGVPKDLDKAEMYFKKSQ